MDGGLFNQGELLVSGHRRGEPVCPALGMALTHPEKAYASTVPANGPQLYVIHKPSLSSNARVIM